MTLNEFSDLAGAVESLATIAALAVGAYWTYVRFVRTREDHPLIQFWLDIEVLGKFGSDRVVELIAYVENKGKVQHRLDDLSFDLFSLNRGDSLNRSSEYGNQSEFPHAVLKGSWLPAKFQYFFVEPGIRAKYSFITHVPAGAEFLMLHGWFQYHKTNVGHSAEKTVALQGLAPVAQPAVQADGHASGQ